MVVFYQVMAVSGCERGIGVRCFSERVNTYTLWTFTLANCAEKVFLFFDCIQTRDVLLYTLFSNWEWILSILEKVPLTGIFCGEITKKEMRIMKEFQLGRLGRVTVGIISSALRLGGLYVTTPKISEYQFRFDDGRRSAFCVLAVCA